jgi:methylglutaconyl-CoA hydratase
VTDIVLVESRGGVARVTLNRPELRNAFDEQLIARLTAELQRIDRDPAVRVVVLAANGPAFCAGADLNWMRRMSGYSYAENLDDARALARMLSTLDRMSKPTIARVQGHAMAGGTGLVAACDMAIGVPAAEFALTEAKLGLSPATISPYVIRAIGERAAQRYFLTAERFSAATAVELGLLNAVANPEELDASIDALVGHLLQGSPAAITKIKDLIRAVASRPIDEPLIEDTAKRIADIRVSPEGKEGIAAFLGKRKAAWIVGPS